MSTEGGLQRQFYDMLMESQWWPADDLRDYQRSQLGQLLRHAKKNVPFYETRLDAVLKPNGDIDWDKWGEIPIVKRQDMVEHREAMQAKELPKGHGPTAVFETSGSTGVTIKRTATSIGTLANNALRWRVHRWHNLDWSKTLCTGLGSREQALEWPDGKPLGQWGPKWDETARRGGMWQISRSTTAEYLADFLEEHPFAYLNSGPNMTHVHALDAERLGLNIRFEALLAQGGPARPVSRATIERVFGAKTIEHYSSKEGGQIAHACDLDILHVNSETCRVEVLDEGGQPVVEGQKGRVVITPFFETAQPLVRYDQGDMAVLGGRCACGRKGMTLASVLGRAGVIFTHPDGRGVVDYLPTETTNLLNCEYWQLAQVGPLDFELRFVPRGSGPPADQDAVQQLFHRIYFPDATLKFIPSSDIAPAISGKLGEYVNEWKTVN